MTDKDLKDAIARGLSKVGLADDTPDKALLNAVAAELQPLLRDESKCATAPSATHSAVQPVTGTTCDTGTNGADTWKTVIVGLPIIRKLLDGQNVELSSFHISLIPNDVLWNARPKSAAQPSTPASEPESLQDGECHSDGSEKQLVTPANREGTRQKIEVPTALVQPEGASRRDEASPANLGSREALQEKKAMEHVGVAAEREMDRQERILRRLL